MTVPPKEAAKTLSALELQGAVGMLSDNLKRITQPSIEKVLVGYINAYYCTKDHGFITAQDGGTYFFHLTAVSDGMLRDKILAMPSFDWAAPVEGTVEFHNAGKTRSQAKYPEAKGLKLISVN